MDKQYLVLRCVYCGLIMIIPTEQMSDDLICMRGHKDVRVSNAYDNLCECMDHAKYRRNSRGALEQDG